MNPIRVDLGYDPGPCSLVEFLAAYPEWREVCESHGWWTEAAAAASPVALLPEERR